MRRTALTIAALCAAATVAASAHAGVKWQDMTTAQKTVVVKKAVRHDRTVLRWWGNHRGPPAAFRVWSLNEWKRYTPAWPACPAIDRQVPAKVCAAATRLPRAKAVLVRLLTPADCKGGASPAACAWYFQGDTQCEVDHEGGWTSVSSHGTYHGRFQTDADFERGSALGRTMQDTLGRSSNWPPWAQIQHAYTVWLERGWRPWPPYYKYGCAAYIGGTYG